jgi:hypothetical protein
MRFINLLFLFEILSNILLSRLTPYAKEIIGDNQCLDMATGYHQIALAPGEGPKAAFNTKQGHWEYLRLPFGLKTAPATFQKMMNSVLC